MGDFLGDLKNEGAGKRDEALGGSLAAAAFAGFEAREGDTAAGSEAELGPQAVF